MVRIQAHTILAPTIQFTLRCPWERPTPRMAEGMTEGMRGGVRGGTPRAGGVRMPPADDVSAQKPWTGESFTISVPTVLMIRHPPIAVPTAIETAQERITQSGM